MTDALSFEAAQRILENSFSPSRCICQKDVNSGTVIVNLFEPGGALVCSLGSVDATKFSSVRNVAQLALELKQKASGMKRRDRSCLDDSMAGKA
jgi:hypothetical protein